VPKFKSAAVYKPELLFGFCIFKKKINQDAAKKGISGSRQPLGIKLYGQPASQNNEIQNSIFPVYRKKAELIKSINQ
jgi:hypothetical protein